VSHSKGLVKSLRPLGVCLLLSGNFLAFAQQYTISTFAGGAPPSTPTAAISTSIGSPQRTVIDAAGNLYFSSANTVFKMDTQGILTVVAGTSKPGFSGDTGPATSARLNNPQGIALDSAGNIYIADAGNNCVRMISTAGIITTVAGNQTASYYGDGFPATAAALRVPSGIVLDSSGNLYIADTGNHAIRKVTRDGNIATFAGYGAPGYSGDGGVSTSGQLSSPSDVAIDPSGNIYIADTGNAVIRLVTASTGVISTVAGNNTTGSTGDGGPAVKAALNAPHGIAVDSTTNIYISEYGDSRIRKVSKSNGNISTIAGTGSFGFSGDGGAATKANLANPWGISVDGSGNVYFADQRNNRIRKISSSGTIGTAAGNGVLSYSGDNGPAIRAQLNGPQGIATDAAGNVYIVDGLNNAVRKVSTAGVISTIAGTGTLGFSGDGGQGTSAQLNRPQAVAADAAGNVYIADTGNNRVRVVSPSGVISTISGTGASGFAGDGGPASSAQLNAPQGLTLDSAGNLYVATFNDNRVRKISAGGMINTIAGNGGFGYAGDGGPGPSAILNAPQGLAVDAAGNVYIADAANNRIRAVSHTGIITTIAGTGVAGHSGDGGPATQALIAAPNGLAMDAAGNLFFADANNYIRKISPDGTISTIAGNGSGGYLGDGGLATSAQVNGPAGIALDSAGDIYVSDTFNNSIRLLQPAGYGLSISAVANGGSNTTGVIAPGEIVAIYGSGLGPATGTQFQLDSNGLVSTSLAGTRVLFNGAPAPVLYAGATQVNAVVPFGITSSNAQVVVQYQSQTSAPTTVSVSPAAPGLFILSPSGQAAAINQTGSINSGASPAKAGSIISLFATGGGQTSPAGIDGSLAAVPLPQPIIPVTATIGGQPATVQYAGGAPGLVAGVMQINVQIPGGTAAGSAVPIVVQVGTVSSQPGVTIAVSAN
jgi:trimeric autotransporter adhesin